MAFGNKNKQAEIPQEKEPVNPAGAGSANPGTEVAKMEDRTQAPSFLQQREQSGAGVSTKQEDNQVPMVYVLQTNSPAVNKRGEDYVEGAEPGDLWLKNSARPIVKGEDGFEFQPCAFITKFVEWVHRDDGGGFVDAYDDARVLDDEPEGKRTVVLYKVGKEVARAKEGPDRKDPAKIVWIINDGNNVKETKYYTGFARFNGLTMPYVIPMSSSFLTPSKQWMGLITSKMNDAGKLYDIWTSWYRVTTKLRKKGENTWFVPVVHDLGFIETVAEDARGKTLHLAVMSGEKQIDYGAEKVAGDGEDGGQEQQSDRM